MRLISARWVVPIAEPPIADGGVIIAEAGSGAATEATPPGGAAVGQARIVAVGKRAQLRRAFPEAPECRADGVLVPALVNSHAHLELSALAEPIPGGDGLLPWTRRLADRLPALSAAEIEAAAVNAAHAARASGTVAMADVGNGTVGWRALGRVGLEGVFFHELLGSREARTGDALADAAAERRALPAAERPAHIPAVPAPHAPYSVGPDLIRRIFATAAADQHRTTIHLAEDGEEIHLLRDGGGRWPAVLRALGVDPAERVPRLGPTAYLERLGAFAGTHPPLLVHMVHASADDRARARAASATVVLCPRSNLHIGGRLPDVPALLDDGVRIALGTDSLASVSDLSLWQEVAVLAENFREVPATAWLHAATRAGAAALGLEHLGTIAIGQAPGLLDVVPDIDLDGRHLGARDVEQALVSTARPSIRWLDDRPRLGVHASASASAPASPLEVHR